MPISNGVKIPPRIPFKVFEQLLFETAIIMRKSWEEIAGDVLSGLEQHGVTVEKPKEIEFTVTANDASAEKPAEETPLGSDPKRLAEFSEEVIKQQETVKRKNSRKTSTIH